MLVRSGVCKAHGEASKYIMAGIVRQADKVFTSLEDKVSPLEIHPVLVGKYRQINYVKGCFTYSKIAPSKERQ